MAFPVGEAASLGAAACWALGLNLYLRDVRGIGARAVNLFKGIVGTALFLLALACTGTASVSGRAQALLAVSGILGLALGDTLLFRALALLGPHRAALFGCLGPVLTALAGWLIFGEALAAWQIAGIVLAGLGVAMVVRSRAAPAPGASPVASGVLFGVASAACHAAGVLLAKRGLLEAAPLTATTLRLGAATAVLALFALARGGLDSELRRLFAPAPLRRLVPAVAIATFTGLWLMQVGIQRAPSAVANALHSTTPLFTLPLAVLARRERLERSALLGSFLAVGGVGLLFLAAG
ncbi:MAG: DMT family transporter [Planctomycetaceae bacterium]